MRICGPNILVYFDDLLHVPHKGLPAKLSCTALTKFLKSPPNVSWFKNTIGYEFISVEQQTDSMQLGVFIIALTITLNDVPKLEFWYTLLRIFVRKPLIVRMCPL